MSDLISKEDAIEAHCELCADKGKCPDICPDVEVFNLIPSAQNVPNEDLISRKTAIKAIDDLPNCYNGYSDAYDKAYIIGVLEELPSAQPDLSDYSDKLWRAAYERGKKEAMESIVRCKDCEWWSQGFPYDYCDKHQIASDGDCFCIWSAERREDDR